MKPHEEEWNRTGRVILVPRGEDGTTDAVLFGDITMPEDRVVLAAAAPNMARALLANMDERADGTMHHKTECSADTSDTCDAPLCVQFRDSLCKAGVLTCP